VIAKGILEGLTFELRVNLELLRDAGVGIEELHAMGGGERSALWLALKADICGLPLRSATRELQTRRARRTLTGIYDDAPLRAGSG
jgi:sugar (pentulose or hexulose) kinase